VWEYGCRKQCMTECLIGKKGLDDWVKGIISLDVGTGFSSTAILKHKTNQNPVRTAAGVRKGTLERWNDGTNEKDWMIGCLPLRGLDD
jgi:hypothetical protein